MCVCTCVCCVWVCVCLLYVSVCVCVGTYINIIHMSCVRAYSSVCVCMFVCTHMCGFGSMETCVHVLYTMGV